MAQILQLSEAASLALHGVVVLASSPEKALSTHRLAEATKSSENHYSKVLQRLVKAGILKSIRGPAGGFALAKPADEISLLDIYEAIEGRLETGGCPARHGPCLLSKCLFGGIASKFNREIKTHLETTLVSDMLSDTGQGE